MRSAIPSVILITIPSLLPPALAFHVFPTRQQRFPTLPRQSSNFVDIHDDEKEGDPTLIQTAVDPITLQRTMDPTNLLMPIDPIEVPLEEQQQQAKQPALIETIGGGTTMIFEMARRMLVWDESERKTNTLPRWHPHSGVSDVNPSFRTQPPIMNNQGYASTIWRNVRKNAKPSLWRYALRTYDRMEQAAKDTKTSPLRIEQNWIHHEGALLACAKLGLWREALEIIEKIKSQNTSLSPKNGVTDHMVFSLVKACVRGCKSLRASEHTLEQRRAPLDAAVRVLNSMEWNKFPLLAKHLNPLASAYQSLGLEEEARNLLKDNLKDRSIGPEPENGRETPNIHNLGAKDKASYALLVKGAIASGSWVNAVAALEDMTEAGLYPTSSHLNQWKEVSEQNSRQRTSRSWKKKRDEYWLKSVQ